MEIVLTLTLLMSLPAPAQDRKVDSKKVDAAIDRGIRFLATAESTGYPSKSITNADELILFTLLHAGLSERTPKVQEILKRVLDGPLERTYKVALQAMVLEELDRVKYQSRIWQCAQFLVDNQCQNGQWSYGDPTPAVTNVPTQGSPRNVATATQPRDPAAAHRSPGKRMKPRVIQNLPVRKTRDGPASGDNSNSQYAALGLRACHDAGIVLPREVVQLAQKAWRTSQHVDEDKKGERPSVATGGAVVAPAGWCYCAGQSGHAAYGSMTTGAVGALTIYAHMLGEKWKADPTILGGLAWMAANFSVTGNPGTPEWGGGSPQYKHLYYLYALERACILWGTETLGGHSWYREGAGVLLAAQSADGSWNSGGPAANSTWDTCFAILFLKRATQPLVDVASVDRYAPPRGDSKKEGEDK